MDEMGRREFLKATAAGTAAITLPGCLSLGRARKKPNVIFLLDDVFFF